MDVETRMLYLPSLKSWMVCDHQLPCMSSAAETDLLLFFLVEAFVDLLLALRLTDELGSFQQIVLIEHVLPGQLCARTEIGLTHYHLEHTIAERAEHHGAGIILDAVQLLVLLCLCEMFVQLQRSQLGGSTRDVTRHLVPTSSRVLPILGCLSVLVR